MQILHPFAGSIQEYDEEIADPSRYRPDHCPQCQAAHELTAHGFYRAAGWWMQDLTDRSVCAGVVVAGVCFTYLRFGISVIALFLIALCSVTAPWARLPIS